MKGSISTWNVEECTSIDSLKEIASQGGFSCCQDCPRHPNKGNLVFAEGCPEHQTRDSPIILFVARDPSSPQRKGVIGCSTDGRVCPWCHTDTSANNFREILYPLIERIFPKARMNEEGRYPVYCINAVLHGPKHNAPPPRKAIKACSHIVKAYVRLLKPKLVIALGVDARTSIEYAFGLRGLERTSYPFYKDGVAFWWSYHHSGRVFNIRRQEIEHRFKQIGEYLNINYPL
jgi:uracil-DNA glycosylase family 4